MQWYKIAPKLYERSSKLHMICISFNNDRHFFLRSSVHFTALYSTCRHLTSSHLNFTQLHFTPLHYTCRHFTSSHLNFTHLHFNPLHYTCRHFAFSHLNFTQLHFTPLHFTAFVDTSLLPI